MSIERYGSKGTDMTDATRKPDEWIMVVDLSSPIPGTIEDWPAHIAEPIFEQIEKQCKARIGWEVRVVSSGCFFEGDKHFVRVVVAEFPTEQTLREWKNGRLN